jgi:4-amino-4-deoxy-L-arabinose transferase-like glycosyltransferase
MVQVCVPLLDGSRQTSAATSGSGPWVVALGLLGLLTLIRIYAAATLGLGDAEAYYWTWSRHLATGYLDHGPVVAWLIRLGTTLGGHSTLAVRAPFILISAATAVGCAALAVRLAHGRTGAAAWASTALLAMPAFLVAGPAANPDVPLVALVVALLATLLAAEASSRPLAWLALAGLLVGLAASTKLFGLVLLLPLTAAAWRARPRPGALALSSAGALVGAAPILLWNLEHGFATFHYHLVLRHTRPAGPSLANLGKLVGGQLGYVSPLLLCGLLAVLVGLWHRRRSSPERTLLLCSLPLLLAGWALILVVPSAEPHWPIAGYIPLLVALAAELSLGPARKAVRGLVAAAIVLALILGVGIHLYLLSDVGVRLMPASYNPRFDLSNELHGWPEVAAAIRAQRQPDEPVAGCHYTVCSQLAFASRGAFRVLCPSPRLDQFDLAAAGDGSSYRGDLLYVMDERFPFSARELYRCTSVDELRAGLVKRADRIVRRFRLQRCRGFLGLRALQWPPPP